MSYIEMDVLACDSGRIGRVKCAGFDSDISSENEATYHIEFILPYLC